MTQNLYIPASTGGTLMSNMPLITSIEELTAEVITDLLQAADSLTESQHVTAVEPVSFGDQSGLLSYLYRVGLTYSDGAQGPATVVVKLPTDDPNQRGISDALGFYNRECTYYNVVAPTAPFKTATIFGQAQATDSTDFIIVMEDLGHMERIDQVVGATLPESETVLKALAKLHAVYWGHQDLENLSSTFLPMDNPIYHAALPGIFGAGWASLKVNAPDLLDPEIIEFGDNYSTHLPQMLASLNTPTTLLHGDYRADNLLLDEEGNLAVIDFQITSMGNCAFDIAYFLSSSVTSETRAAHADQLLHLYHDTLTAEGVNYSFEDLEAGFRVALAFCLIYGVASFAGWDSFGERQQELMRSMASRTIYSILETNALDSLNAN
jgi:hypothetical protein